MNAISRLDAFFRTHPLTKTEPNWAWGRFLSWQIRSRLQQEVIVPWIDGTRLAVRRGMTGATGNIYVGLHEFADMALVLHFLRPGDLFLDVGANVGSFTILASGVCGARSWAFEPHPETMKRLQRNVTINALDGLVTRHQCALGRERGLVSFTADQDTTNCVTTGNTGLTVRQEAIDDLVGSESPLMIKMDVEGGEESAILGAMDTLAKPSLKLIEIETVTAGVREAINSKGFKQFHYIPLVRALVEGPSREVAGANTVFVRDVEFVRARLRDAKPISVLGHRF